MGRVLHCLCILLMVADSPFDASAAQSLTDEERSLLKLFDNARSNIPDIARIMEKSKVEEVAPL